MLRIEPNSEQTAALEAIEKGIKDLVSLIFSADLALWPLIWLVLHAIVREAKLVEQDAQETIARFTRTEVTGDSEQIARRVYR